MHQPVWHLWYVDTAIEGGELYCYNMEGDRNSVVNHVSCRMDVTRLEQNSQTVNTAVFVSFHIGS